MPLLKRADHVVVVEIAGEEELAAARTHVEDVVGWLERHGVVAEALACRSSGDEATRLSNIAQEQDADLIVAGAYGHSRLHEWVLGGVTRDLLLRRIDARSCHIDVRLLRSRESSRATSALPVYALTTSGARIGIRLSVSAHGHEQVILRSRRRDPSDRNSKRITRHVQIPARALDRIGIGPTKGEVALQAADPSSAHIEFLHVRMDIRQVMVMLSGSGMTLGTGLVGLEQEAEERERRAQEGFRAFCAEYKLNATNAPGAGLSASWSVMTGEKPACLAQRARVADAIVLGRGKRTICSLRMC